MEQSLQKCISEIISTPNTTGCLFANRQGLCYGAAGTASEIASGIAVAISEQACKLEPNANPPIIALEGGNKTCLIQRNGAVTGVIFKQNGNQR
ncbi:uncharacterized protein LOC119653842 [Hermetia illucens]|uniref:uncharacterized protein LOC119653842 n=1 Tax=Hermetia illucens TaxID=343691 RepID=UPI0018CC26D0|nr:uncharacterized protein LOC119653842 [Hermetia illucens]